MIHIQYHTDKTNMASDGPPWSQDDLIVPKPHGFRWGYQGHQWTSSDIGGHRGPCMTQVSLVRLVLS